MICIWTLDSELLFNLTVWFAHFILDVLLLEFVNFNISNYNLGTQEKFEKKMMHASIFRQGQKEDHMMIW
jgi:hypothetical protein